MIKGSHIVTKRRNGQPAKHYVYAWRGGPQIMTKVGGSKPVLDAKAVERYHEAVREARFTDDNVLSGLCADWRASGDWKNLAASTKQTWSIALSKIEEKWGAVPLRVWSDWRMTARVVAWRDQLAAKPRAADIAVTVLRAVLEWGRLRGRVSVNVATGIPAIWKGGQRSEILWTTADIEAFREVAPQHVFFGLKLAALTGFRREDLITIRWAEVGDFAITRTAKKKSRGQRQRATVPIIPELRVLLDELRKQPRAAGVETLLVNSRGKPWTGGGFTQAFNAVRDRANSSRGIVHVSEHGDEPDRKKHLHDVRGTFATKLMALGSLSDKEVAEVMGWSPDHVRSIRKLYVDDASVVVAIAERIAREM